MLKENRDEKLEPDKISAHLEARIIGRKIISYEETGSTNDVAEHLAGSGEKEGACVFAEKQTKGRGRLGRHWSSPRGGIYLSVILRPKIMPQEAAKLTLVAAVALARVLREEAAMAVDIKWPNDLLVNGKKVCGILTQMSAETDIVKFIILGIGINVNTKRADLPKTATSLAAEAGRRFSRIMLARKALVELDKYYCFFKKDGFEEILDEWRGFSSLLGKRISVARRDDHKERLEGYAHDVDELGSLILRLDNGFLRAVSAGDVTLLR